MLLPDQIEKNLSRSSHIDFPIQLSTLAESNDPPKVVTLYKKISFQEPQDRLILYTPNFRDAADIFVNGKLVFSHGSVGKAKGHEHP